MPCPDCQKIADRLEEAERDKMAAEYDAGLERANAIDAANSRLEAEKRAEKAEREVERVRGLANDAAHELVACNALAYAERLRAALRGGDRE